MTGQIGLKPVSVDLETTKGKLIHLNLSPTPNKSASSTAKNSISPTSSQAVSNNLLYLMLKYGMSQKCYHELTQEFDCLPRSYKVSYYIATQNVAIVIQYIMLFQVKEAIKAIPTLEVSRTSNFTGAQFHFSDMLHKKIETVVSYVHAAATG